MLPGAARAWLGLLCGLAGLGVPRASRAQPSGELVPMTPDLGAEPNFADRPSGSGPAPPVRAGAGGGRSAFITSGVITMVLGAVQLPAGVAPFVAGSESDCKTGSNPRGKFVLCTNSPSLAALGIEMMVSGGLGVITGVVLIGVGASRPRVATAQVVPRILPGPSGGALEWTF